MSQTTIPVPEPDVVAYPATWLSVFASVGIAAAVALASYVLIVRSLINPYIENGSEAGRVLGVYRGYERIAAQHAASPECGVVLFWGSSMIREGVDSHIVESLVPNIAA